MELIEENEYKITELYKFYGGLSQGGILTPIKYKYVFIIAYKNSGKEFGYEDGWDEERNFYLYIGKGQVGNMKFLQGNKAT